MASATNVLCHQSKFNSSVLDVLNLWGVHVVKFSQLTLKACIAFLEKSVVDDSVVYLLFSIW